MRAVTMIPNIWDESRRSRALSTLAPHLSDHLKSRALNLAREIKDATFRNQALVALVPYLDREVQNTVLQETMCDYSLAFHEVLRIWNSIGFAGFEEVMIRFVKVASKKERRSGMEVVSAFTPALIHLRGPEIADELYRAITDTARWWP